MRGLGMQNTGFAPAAGRKETFAARAGRDFRKNSSIYLMLLPVVIYYLIFNYKPLYGLLIAFKNYSPRLGVMRSPWVGLVYFRDFFSSYYFKRILCNTLWISVNGLIWSFPFPIIFALLINEIRSKSFVRITQTITYMPHFISIVVIAGIIKQFVSDSGIVTQLLGVFGMEQTNLLENPDYFVPIYIVSDIWQNFGWSSIIFLAAISGIDMELYEAAKIDGAGRFRQVLNVTIPGIIPTIVIMLILRMGKILNVGFEKIILLYSPVTYKTADVISTFVYRRGLLENDWSYSTAVGIFNSIVNFTLITASNSISKRLNETALW